MTVNRPESTHPWLCVLASGSSGNCSVLVWPTTSGRRAALIDMGLSPRRTTRLLADIGIDLSEITDTFLTHLDADHFHPGWVASKHLSAPLRMHKRHVKRAVRQGIATRRTEPFEHELSLPGMRMYTALGSHDQLGVCTFRFSFAQCDPRNSSSDACRTSDLGFATDVGRMTQPLIDHLAGVDVLAIESNYCPVMELASDRPEFLKRRVMGGSGHLSNAECAAASRLIAPRDHVVLLHLSRQCNQPTLALREHNSSPYNVTVSTADAPTPIVPIPASPTPPRSPSPPHTTPHSHSLTNQPSHARRPVQHLLFAAESSV